MALATLLGLGYSVWHGRRKDQSDADDRAREEAVSLADTRGQMIEDMRRDLVDLKDQLTRERQHSDGAIKRLEQALEHARTEAQETQRLLVVGLRGVVVKLLGHLEATPIETEAAVVYLREMLSDDVFLRRPRFRQAP